MNWMKTVELLREYATCPHCGSDKLGNGAGTVEVTDDTFTRTCKCGWKVEIEVTEEKL